MRQHEWKDQSYSPDSFLEERICRVCDLTDRRLRNVANPFWQVTTPCIEPVPDLVRFEDLMEELRAHGVRETPMAIGHPGNWQIGFALLQQKSLNRHGTCPRIPIAGNDTLEHGWARLMRWIRARQYSVNMYSTFFDQYKLHNRSDDDCGDDGDDDD